MSHTHKYPSAPTLSAASSPSKLAAPRPPSLRLADDRENCAKAATIGLYPFFCPKHLTAVTWTRACDNLPAVQSKFKRSAAASLAAAADTANPAAGHHLAPLPAEDPSSSS